MLAPPGYAKIVSTPSRSRQATRISLPDIAGPSSGRLFAAFLVSLCAVLLIGCFAVFSRTVGRRRIKKPTTVASRGFLSKLNSRSTSPYGGVAYDDDQQSHLS